MFPVSQADTQLIPQTYQAARKQKTQFQMAPNHKSFPPHAALEIWQCWSRGVQPQHPRSAGAAHQNPQNSQISVLASRARKGKLSRKSEFPLLLNELLTTVPVLNKGTKVNQTGQSGGKRELASSRLVFSDASISSTLTCTQQKKKGGKGKLLWETLRAPL